MQGELGSEMGVAEAQGPQTWRANLTVEAEFYWMAIIFPTVGGSGGIIRLIVANTNRHNHAKSFEDHKPRQQSSGIE